MKVVSDKCYDSGEYIDMVTGTNPGNISFDEWESTGNADQYWSYCLSDVSEIPEDSLVVLVRFFNSNGSFEYRFGELPL